MAKPVEIKSATAPQTDNIIANPAGVRFTGNGVVQFRNYLSEQVTLKFYSLDAKGTGIPIPDFCQGEMSGPLDDQLVITATNNPSPKIKLCDIDQVGEFAYTVEAANHNPLDPVIIIDPQHQANVSGGSTVLFAGLLLVGAAALTYYLGYARGKASS